MDFFQRDYEEIEKIFPLDADWIARVWAAAIDWSDGTIVPFANIPIQDILDAISNSSDAGFIVAAGFTQGLVINWRDDTTLYCNPGQVAHRGQFKRQGLDPNTLLVRQIIAAASLRDTVADGGPGTSGLAPDQDYYVYAKMDAASSYPEYRISKTPPTNDEGYGREHPTEHTLRFLSFFRTGGLPNAAIRPYDCDGDGNYFWREILIGPLDPAFDLYPAGGAATYCPVDLSTQCPPIADKAFLTTFNARNTVYYFRTSGDDPDKDTGYAIRGHTSPGTVYMPWFVLPVNVIDGIPGTRMAGTTVDVKGPNSPVDGVSDLGVAGFHISRE